MIEAAIDKALKLSPVDDLQEIAFAAGRGEAFREEHRLPEEIAFEVRPAVDRPVTGTICYGDDDDGEHRIQRALRLEGGALIVRIADEGRPFDRREFRCRFPKTGRTERSILVA